MYAVAIAHTLDDKFRRGQVRSRNFKWFSACWCGISRTDFRRFSTRECDVEECKAFGDDSDESRKWLNCESLDPQLRLPSWSTRVHRHQNHRFPLASVLHCFCSARKNARFLRRSYEHLFRRFRQLTHKLWRDAKDGLVTKVSINGPYGSGFTHK